MGRITPQLQGIQVGVLRSCSRPARRACAHQCRARLQSDQRSDIARDSTGKVAVEELADARSTRAQETAAPVDEQVMHQLAVALW